MKSLVMECGNMINRLKQLYLFPQVKPTEISQHPGWFYDEDAQSIKNLVEINPNIIIEIGSWAGKSTKWFLTNYEANIICIDTWNGSPEFFDENHLCYKDVSAVLPFIYNTFIHNLWDYRDRVIPIQEDSLGGLKIVAQHNIKPDIIFIDASHEEEDVYNDLKTAHTLFPQATIIGHDYISEWQSVINGVDRYAQEEGRSIINSGRIWKLV